MTLERDLAKWERRLRREGLGLIERSYRTLTDTGVHQFTTIERQQRATEFSDYFSRCGEFAGQLRVWVRIWILYSQGCTFDQIASRTKQSRSAVQYRIKELRRAMIAHFARTTKAAVPLAPEAERARDIVEIFVEASHQGD